jgi:SAM-dependent methyltransferase
MKASEVPNLVNAVQWWAQSLACPACRQPLACADECRGCGLTFERDSGTPVLIARDAVAEVAFRFPQQRSEKSDAQRLQYVRYPPALSKGVADIPYHLDRAHAARLVKLAPGSRVLEIGCGGGQMRGWFERAGLKYVGVDLSKTRVYEWLQAYGGPDLLSDAHFLPFQDEQFDVVYSTSVTEHVACPVRYAQEARRVLKPGGLFLSNSAFLEPWHDASHFHLSPDGAIELLLEAGFEIEAVWPERGYHAFRSILEMAFRRPFRVVRHLGWMPMALYRLQGKAINLYRRLRGTAPLHRVLDDGIIAGAVNWIARR